MYARQELVFESEGCVFIRSREFIQYSFSLLLNYYRIITEMGRNFE